jgi:FAD/FMN-containing dehydrogenase
VGLKARALDGSEVTLADGALVDLKAGLRGPVFVPGEPGYHESRSLWNGMIDRHPSLAVRCLGAADVMRAVGFAREQGILVSVKGGGHNISGLAACDGGLLLDMSLMRGVWVDPARRVARAQAGCLLGDVDRETQLHGLAAVLGFVSNTGIAGLTLGGGFGYLTRRFGWTSDNVLAIDLVTAAGELVRASESENEDLFWALRGGGGNFGVVTGIDYRLHPVGPQVTAGLVAWRAEAAADVLELYRNLADHAPEDVTLVALLRLAPPAPWLPREIHGQPIVAILVCHSGHGREGGELIARVKGFGTPVGDVLVPRPYVAQQSLLDATQPKGRRYYWKSEYLARLDPELFARAAEHARHITSPHSAIVVFALGGAVGKLPDEHSPVGNRDAASVFNVTASWEQAADDEANIGWARAAWRDLKRFSSGGTYVNFLTEEETGERIRAAYGGHYDRLVDVKTAWDPGNLFRANKNIAPRSR